MKPLSQRKVAEVLAVYERHGIPLPETDDGDKPTQKELVAHLNTLGINNKTNKEWELKHLTTVDLDDEPGEDAPQQSEPEDDDMVVVMMTRRNPIFTWREYTFSPKKPFVPMPKKDALDLVQKYDGFHVAKREEIKRYYK